MSHRPFILAIIALLVFTNARAQNADIVGFHAGFAYPLGGRLYSDVVMNTDHHSKVWIRSRALWLNDQDSLLIYSCDSIAFKLKPGVNKLRIEYLNSNRYSYVHAGFERAMHALGALPCGNYLLYVDILEDTGIVSGVFQSAVDSLLPPEADLYRELQEVQIPEPSATTSLLGATQRAVKKMTPNTPLPARSLYRIESLLKKRGLQYARVQDRGKDALAIWSGEWFLGLYHLTDADRMNQGNSASDRMNLAQQKETLGKLSSLSERLRQMSRQQREEHRELEGEISVAGQFSNDQEQYSGIDNQYYEIQGNLSFPVMDIPVSVAGYYTTQDRNREAKASFLHFRYDAEKAKEQLMKLIGGFNSGYENSLRQGLSYDMLYGQVLDNLQREKDKALLGLAQDAGIPVAEINSLSADEIQDRALSKLSEQSTELLDSVQQTNLADSAQVLVERGRKVQHKAMATKEEIVKKYEQIKALESKIHQYRGMLDQYKNTLHYDSLLAYGQLKELKDIDQSSYREMAKRASGLLPEGKAKKLMDGLASFDAGIFPKQISNYTMAGQMLKGADLGYDFGMIQAGATYGTTEYIDRSGKVERYKAYGARVQMKPLLNQQIGLVYYGYTPSKKLLNDDSFFKGEGVSLPSFRNPVQIMALTHKGTLSEHIEIEAEYALSDKPSQSAEARSSVGLMAKSAWNVQTRITIPKTSIQLNTAYEQAGAAFENNTLPMLLAGTNRFKIEGTGDFFRSFLKLGVSYHHMLQQNLYATGTNARWGFDIATRSRRYPSVALSYKPFSTFRAYDDTLNIEQKPMIGSVWTGRISYQIKRPAFALRWHATFNRQQSIMDTLEYSNSLLQINTIYTRGTTMLALTVGSNQLQSGKEVAAFPAYNSGLFATVSAAGKLTEMLLVSGGWDIARNKMGWSRYGFFLSPIYNFRKLPFSIRGNFRYTNYIMDEVQGWRTLLSGGLELSWRFRYKLKI